MGYKGTQAAKTCKLKTLDTEIFKSSEKMLLPYQTTHEQNFKN